MEKPRNITTRQYVGLVYYKFKDGTDATPVWQNQLLDKSELLDYLANKGPRSHKAVLISQGFNPEAGDLGTFVEHCEWSDTTDNITMAKVSASDEESDTKRQKKRSKFKGREKNGKKRHKRNSSLYCSLHGENKSHTSR